MSDRHQIHATISGYVQGVSFRFYTMQTANALDCVGWVRNKPDGTVECLAQGSTDQLESLINFLQEGPPAAQVENVDVEWQTPQETYSSFRVIR